MDIFEVIFSSGNPDEETLLFTSKRKAINYCKTEGVEFLINDQDADGWDTLSEIKVEVDSEFEDDVVVKFWGRSALYEDWGKYPHETAHIKPVHIR